jgi:outer membrane protein OmpA-like peptidoglycan-associated protein
MAKAEARDALASAQALSERVAELEARKTNRGLVITLSDILFDSGKATLKVGADRALVELTSFLNEYEDRNLLIEGFTDNVGTTEYNQDLSVRRANAVRRALVLKGVADTRIRTDGLGERYPVATNDTGAGRQQNRRVEIVISDESGMIPGRDN